MRKLLRDPVPPSGLSKYRHGRDQWADVRADHRAEIWAKLDAMQGKRCAYCEDAIAGPNRHFEHFRQRDRFPAGTFAWDNLFGSCNRKTSCGKRKDSIGPYPHENLIKPDIEDPEAYLIFTPNGSVQPRTNLDAAAKTRAEHTIRVLGLDGALTQIRKTHVAGYLQMAMEIAEVAQESPIEEWLPFLEDELQRVAHLPFATAIKHVLTPQSD